jgi:hypothetical protein
MTIVNKAHMMSDEALILDRNPLADKRMRADLAPGSHAGILLNFNEGANSGLFTNTAAVKVDQFRMCDLHIRGQANVFRYWHWYGLSIISITRRAIPGPRGNDKLDTWYSQNREAAESPQHAEPCGQ